MYAPITTPIPVSHYDQQLLSPISQYTVQEKPSFRRRDSVDSSTSILTRTSSKTKRQTILKAIISVDPGMDQKHLQDIVDMMLTLKKKDLATCLFNKVFLRSKIKQAKDALDIFDEQTYEDDDDVIMMLEEEPYYNSYQYSPPITTIQKVSKAIPIVAPPPDSPKKKEKHESIATFLSTLKDLPSHEQKQLLGDQLFPLVKVKRKKMTAKVVC